MTVNLKRASERFRAATVVLREINAWMDRGMVDPPECVLARVKARGITVDEYCSKWREQDFRQSECKAIEHAAIYAVQPDWRPKS